MENSFIVDSQKIIYSSEEFCDLVDGAEYKGVKHFIHSKSFEVWAKEYSDEEGLFVYRVGGDNDAALKAVKYFALHINPVGVVKLLKEEGYVVM
ncbi:MAG: hypothetical protein JNN11_04225 [Candidatus Doudnabacteria bacterium]|nr:hypothetical protein [Candidatus Doudnabacteria bacterium]